MRQEAYDIGLVDKRGNATKEVRKAIDKAYSSSETYQEIQGVLEARSVARPRI